MFACLIVYGRLRYILPDRRIRAHPPAVLRIQIPRTVVVEPGFLILLFRSELVRPAVVRIAENYFTRRLRGMSVRQIPQAFLFRCLFLYPQLSVRRIFYPLVFIAFKIGHKLRASQVVGVVVILMMPLIALSVACFEFARLLRDDSCFA